jgi:preprotein translocase subunit SecF
MNILKKRSIALYTTSVLALLLLGLLSGDFIGFISLLVTFGIIIGGFILVYNLLIYILNKKFPETISKSIGGSTIVTNFSYDNK